MDDLGVIDRFMEAFTQAIDSGFGLLQGDVAFLTAILIGIDITLAGLFWAMEESNVLGRLLRKVLYVGVFALILNNFAGLADIIFRSFAGLGLHAAENELTADDLLRRAIIQALMCHFELSIESIQIAHLIDFKTYFAEELADLREMEKAGLLKVEDDWITVEPAGRLLVRGIAMVFDRYLRADRERARYSKVI